MKRTIEINDTLQECVDKAIGQVENELTSYLNENPDTDELPGILDELDYSGAIHEIIDGAVPIYTSEINDLFYLYGNELEEAFDNAGIGEKNDEDWPMGWKAAAIYCYIEEKVFDWYNEKAQDIFDEWYEENNPEIEEEEE